MQSQHQEERVFSLFFFIKPMADFERLGVCPEIIQAVSEDGWVLPTPVQDEAIPLILGVGHRLVTSIRQ